MIWFHYTRLSDIKELKLILEWYYSLILQQTRCMLFIGLLPCLKSTCFHCRGHSNKLKHTDVKETCFISCKHPSIPPTMFLGINFKRWGRPVWTCVQPTSSLLNIKACYLVKGKKGAQDNVFKYKYSVCSWHISKNQWWEASLFFPTRSFASNSIKKEKKKKHKTFES